MTLRYEVLAFKEKFARRNVLGHLNIATVFEFHDSTSLERFFRCFR